MNNVTIISDSPQTTRDIGLRIGQALRGGEIIFLHGELGAGKTCLSQGVINGVCGRDDYPRSPTFSIINPHMGRFPIYHVDLYRLAKREDMIESGVEELVNSGAAMIIEWAERMAYLNIPDRIEMTIDDLGGDRRRISVSGEPPGYIKEIFQCLVA